MWDLRKNYAVHRHDPVPLQTYLYPGSSMRTRLGEFCTIMNIILIWSYMQITLNKLNIILLVLQVIPDLSWTPQDPTSCVTALTITSICSMSVE